MLPDLERLIRLQQIDTFIESARRRIDEHPALVDALDAKLAAANDAVATAKHRRAENRAARAAVEKDLAMIQSRLSKFRDQLMEVKTNKEYQAIQKEIEVAQHDVRRLEDRILEQMLEADDLAADVKKAEVGARRRQGSHREGARGARRRRPNGCTSSSRNGPASATRWSARFRRRSSAPTTRSSAAGEAWRSWKRATTLHRVPRPPPAAGVQRDPARRHHPPVRELPADPLLRPPVEPAAGADQPPGTEQ